MASSELLLAKKKLRHHMLGLRRHLSGEKHLAYSQSIWKRLQREVFFKRSNCIFCYASMPDEVQTLAFLKQMLLQGKKVCLPFITGKGKMEAVALPSLDVLTMGDFGILTVQAENRHKVSPETIDCVIVPGAAFGRDGARLGMGGGYYDRFLMKQAVSAFRVAAAFSCQLTDKIPMEVHDCRVDAIVTEEETIFCSPVKW